MSHPKQQAWPCMSQAADSAGLDGLKISRPLLSLVANLTTRPTAGPIAYRQTEGPNLPSLSLCVSLRPISLESFEGGPGRCTTPLRSTYMARLRSPCPG